MRCLRYLTLFALFAVGTATLAADWPRFRGPNGSGIVDDPSIPLTWSKSSNIAWKIALPGNGISSPIVVKDKLFVQSSSKDGTQRMLLCLNANTGVRPHAIDPEQAARLWAMSEKMTGESS